MSSTPGPPEGPPPQWPPPQGPPQGTPAPQGRRPPEPAPAHMSPPHPGAAHGYPGPYGYNPYVVPSPGDDPNRPGSRAWVEQRYGPVTDFSDRVLPRLIDQVLASVPTAILLTVGAVLFVVGLPDYEPCSYGSMTDCEVPGTGSSAMWITGIVLIAVSSLLIYVVWFWNRIWRVSRTGQSIGRRVTGLKVVNAADGGRPTLGAMVLRELLVLMLGIVDWIWMLFDADRRTLGDIVAKTAVVRTER